MTDNSGSVNQIYTIGHQTYDTVKSTFLSSIIESEKKSRDFVAKQGFVKVAYDPILQVEERIIPVSSYQSRNVEAALRNNGKKDQISTAHQANVKSLHGKRYITFNINS